MKLIYSILQTSRNTIQVHVHFSKKLDLLAMKPATEVKQ